MRRWGHISGERVSLPGELSATPGRSSRSEREYSPISAAIESNLHFVIEHLARLPTRKVQALGTLCIMFGSIGLVILRIEPFRRACLQGERERGFSAPPTFSGILNGAT